MLHVEDVTVGVLRGKTLAESMPDLAGGVFGGQLLIGAVILVVLIPFFSVTKKSHCGMVFIHYLGAVCVESGT